MSSTSKTIKVLAAPILAMLTFSMTLTVPAFAQEHMANLGTRGFALSMEMTPTAVGTRAV